MAKKKLKRRPRYDVTTWDVEKQRFTPQRGVRRGPYTLFGLRKALRLLRGMGYDCRGEDPWVYVKCIEDDSGDNLGEPNG